MIDPFTEALDKALSIKTDRKKRKKKKSTYPEPGDGEFPDFPPPGFISSSEIKHQVVHEGLGFCIYDLFPPERIEDNQLAVLWQKARYALREIVAYLENVEYEDE